LSDFKAVFSDIDFNLITDNSEIEDNFNHDYNTSFEIEDKEELKKIAHLLVENYNKIKGFNNVEILIENEVLKRELELKN
jgi:hypothetical protein